MDQVIHLVFYHGFPTLRTSDQNVFDEVLGKRGVRRASYANRTVQVPNDLSEIVKAIELSA